MNNDSFVSNAQALLDLDKDGALVPHGIGGHARSLLEYAIVALAAPQPEPMASEQLYRRVPVYGGHGHITEKYEPIATPQAEPAVAEQARDFEAWWDRQKHSPNFPDMTRPEAVYVWTAALASQSTPPPESAGQGLSDAEIDRICTQAIDQWVETELRTELKHFAEAVIQAHNTAILAANPTAQPDGGGKA